MLHADARFQRGDVDANGAYNLTDAVVTLNFLFRGGITLSCSDGADTNDDGRVNLSDAVFSLSFLFQGGSEPPAPYPTCGTDPTEDEIDCVSYAACPPLVDASFSADPSSGPPPLEVSFDASQSTVSDPDGATYAWDFGDGSQGSGAVVSHTYTEAGAYTVTLTVTDGDGSVDDAQAVIVVGEIPTGTPSGFISIEHTVARSCPGPQPTETARFDITAAFVAIDPDDLPTGGTFGDCEVEESTVAGCELVRSVCVIDGIGGVVDPPEPPDLGELLEGLEGIDPGAPGGASNGTGAETELLPGDGTEIPVQRFLYAPPDETDLLALGFDCQDSVTVSFPGGEGLSAFEAPIAVPPCFRGVKPAGCAINAANNDLVVSWDDAPGYSGAVEVTLSRNSFVIGADDSVTMETVSIQCSFPDDSGSGTIPRAAIAELPPADFLATTQLTLRREIGNAISVPRASGEGDASIILVGSSELTITEGTILLPVK